jgi:hypothetical protein
MLKEDAKVRKRSRREMAYHNIERNAPLIYYTQTMGISGRTLLLYLKLRNSNDLAIRFRWPTQLTLLQVIRLSVLTDQKVSVTLNRLLSNMGQQDSFMFIRGEKIDHIIPVPKFTVDEQIDEVKDCKPLKKIPLTKNIIEVSKDTSLYLALEMLIDNLEIKGD